MPRNTVQSVGNSTYSFSHALINGGVSVNLTGIKLEGTYFKARQIVDNSKMVPLVDGSVSTLTNTIRAGVATITVINQNLDIASGDLVAIARALQLLGDSIGGQLRVATTVNGQTKARTYFGMTLKVFDDNMLAGNDLPEYPIEFNYQDVQDS